jgi:lysophospholipase L1-like esterase
MIKPGARRPLFAAIVFVLFFGVAEFLAGKVDPVFPSWGALDNPSVVLTGHSTRLWGLTAGKRQNLDTVATVSELGLRGEEPVVPRPEGEQRIAIVGDSTFFGFGVADDRTLASVLAKQMPGVTTINAAIPGYSTAQSRRLLDDVVWDAEPTLLVIANFWSDTSFEPYRDKDLLATQDLSNSRLLAHSALMRWLATSLSGLRAPDRSRVVTWVHGNELPPASQRRVELVDYAANLDAMIRDAKTRDIGVILLTPPSPIEVEGIISPPHQWDAYRDMQTQVAEHHGIVHVQATPAFQAVYADTQDLPGLFLDDLHPSVEGQKLLATVVQTALQEAGWPGNPLIGQGDAMDVSTIVDSTPSNLESPPDGNNSPVQNLFVDPDNARRGNGPTEQDGPTMLFVSIHEGTGPYKLTVLHEGTIAASARVAEPRSLSLRVPNGPVTVRVEDGTGAVKESTVNPDSGPVSVVFP